MSMQFDIDIQWAAERVRALLPAVVAHFGQVQAVVNSASTFEHDDAQSFSFAAMQNHLRANTGAAVLLAQALYEHRTRLSDTDVDAGAVIISRAVFLQAGRLLRARGGR